MPPIDCDLTSESGRLAELAVASLALVLSGSMGLLQPVCLCVISRRYRGPITALPVNKFILGIVRLPDKKKIKIKKAFAYV